MRARQSRRAAVLLAVAGVLVALVLSGVRAAGQGAMRLVDVSERLGDFHRPNGPNNAGGLAGAAWFDYDGDGRIDLLIPNNKGRANALFRNLGNGRFRDVAAKTGIANGLGNLAAIAGDIDNDGCMDVFMTGYGGTEVEEKSPTKLYRNDCDGTFRDISTTARVPGTRTSYAAAFGDVNNDGFLDLAVASAGDFQDRKDPNKLYLNNGDLTFTDISASAGIEPNLGSVDIAFVDYNKDGLQDILTDDGNDGVMNPLRGGKQFQAIPGIHRLYRNNGDLTFTDVSAQTGFTLNLGFWMATAWGDYDNDSDLDHFSTSIGATSARDVPSVPSTDAFFPHGFWENVGDGAFFQHKTQEAGLFRPEGSGFGWGATFADFDNDGHMDLFFHGNYPSLAGFLHDQAFMGETHGNPGYLYRNTGHKRFELVQTFGLRDRFTSGSAVADFDNDGMPDVAVVNTAFGKDPGVPILLHNRTANGNGWITVRTVGTRSNRDGLGAKVRVLAGRLTKLQEVRSGSSFLSMDSPWLSFGLGRDTPATVSIEVTWPSGLLEVFHGQPTRQMVTLTEGGGCPLGSASPCPEPSSTEAIVRGSGVGQPLASPESAERSAASTAPTPSAPSAGPEARGPDVGQETVRGDDPVAAAVERGARGDGSASVPIGIAAALLVVIAAAGGGYFLLRRARS